jgi:glycogen operon protein
VRFTLPEVTGGERGLCLVDTNRPDLEDPMTFAIGKEYEVTGRSLLLFELRRQRNPQPA